MILEAHAEQARRELGALGASAPDSAATARPGSSTAPAGEHFGDGILRRRLVPAAELPRLAAARREPRERADLVAAYCRAATPFAHWKEELPFGDLDAAIAAAEPFHASLLRTSVLLQPDLAAAATARLQRFFADFGQRLDFPLDFAGKLFRDDDDVERALAGVADQTR